MDIKNKTLYLTSLLAVFLLPVFYLQALTITVQPPQQPLQVGKTSLVKILLENKDKTREINALEGKIKISSSDDVVSIITGGSIFNLWPIKPSLDKNIIAFAGGTQSGVFGGALNVFTIAIKPKTTEAIQLDFEGVSAYLNDGLGTKVVVAGLPVKLSVLKTPNNDDELSTLVSSDDLAPQSFNIDLGKDLTLYDGKYFISFYSSDNESGIKDYEVTESGFETVKSGNVYVLQNQKLTSTVKVKAIDNAGNERIKTIKLNSGSNWLKTIIFVVLVIVAGLVGYLIIKIKRRKS
ncbi:MAG: hypothetical protein K8Q91_02205 [Candidatus Vogelbacteria bacterium]|nr:hypothetical protein [Candidatus Vogelbacteria bacterium]